jgi:nucleoside-diphosphate-sugar epimerase
MSPGEQISDFVPVEQVARAFLRALELPSEAFHFSPSPPPVSTFPSSPISSFNFPLSTFPLVANIGTGHPQTIRAFAEHWWKEWGATGKLLPGALPYRDNEAMRYVPEVDEKFK